MSGVLAPLDFGLVLVPATLMSVESPRVALVTGANRGSGWRFAASWAQRETLVVLTSRDPRLGEQASARLVRDGLNIRAAQLDVSDAASVERLARWAHDEFGRLDVLVNNAAIDYDTDQRAGAADLERVERAWQTNTLGAWRVTLALLALLRKGTMRGSSTSPASPARSARWEPARPATASRRLRSTR